MKKIFLLLVALIGILIFAGCAAESPAEEPYAGSLEESMDDEYGNNGYVDIDDSWQGGLLLTPEELDEMWDGMFDPDTVQIVVNDAVIEAPRPFINREYGFVMVPVAPIAEALGYVVDGEGFDTVLAIYGDVGRAIAFVENMDAYLIGRSETVSLGAPPMLVDGFLFVPMQFFGQVSEAGAWTA